MKCPRTGTDLTEIEIDGVKIDISESCGGVWFDNFELEKFDNVDKAAGAELVELLAKYADKELDLEPRLQSPRHPEVTMMRQFYSPAQRIEIDDCPQSGGVWLDPGELAHMRLLYPSEDDRREATQQFFDEIMPVFGDSSGEQAGPRVVRMLHWLLDAADWGKSP